MRIETDRRGHATTRSFRNSDGNVCNQVRGARCTRLVRNVQAREHGTLKGSLKQAHRRNDLVRSVFRSIPTKMLYGKFIQITIPAVVASAGK